MRRVSVILPVATPAAVTPGLIEQCRKSLREAGFEAIEVLVVGGPSVSPPGELIGGHWAWLAAGGPGLSWSVMTGLAEARGDILLVLDPTQGYLTDDVARVVEPDSAGRADLVIARRDRAGAPGRLDAALRRAGRLAGRLSRPAIGASDPFAGLLAMTPALAASVTGTFVPVGSRFAVDLLLRARGRKEEVLVRAGADAAVAPLGLDDLRHFKRLADDRYGNVSRLLQFCAVGASGMVVDLTTYALLQLVLSPTWLAGRPAPLVGGPLDKAVARILAILVALIWNFSLNRRMTFNYARGASIPRQFLAYALSNALGIALSLTLSLTLPEHVAFFRRHRLAAAVVGIVAATGLSFSLARWVVFSHRPADDEPGGTTPSDPRPVSEVVETRAGGSYGI
jgi:dolichol-phosphate mannosyltransferase